MMIISFFIMNTANHLQLKKRIRKTERLIRTPNGNFLKSKKKKLINTIYFELKYFRLLKK